MTARRHISPSLLSNPVKGTLCMIFSVIIWGGWVVASRAGMQHASLTSYDIVAIRFMVAGMVFVPIVMRRGIGIGPLGWRGTIICMLLMGAPYNVMCITALGYTPASHSSITYASSTAVSCIVGMLFLKETSSWLRWLGVILGVGGIATLIVGDSNQPTSNTLWIGHVLFLCAGSCWGLYTIIARIWRPNATQATAAMTVFSMLFYLPLYYFFFPKNIMEATWQTIVWQGFYQGLLTNILALISYNKAVEYLGASGAGAFVPLVPVTAAMFAIPGLGELPTTLEWMGIIASAAGVLFASGVIDRLYQRHRLHRKRLGTPPQSDIPA